MVSLNYLPSKQFEERILAYSSCHLKGLAHGRHSACDFKSSQSVELGPGLLKMQVPRPHPRPPHADTECRPSNLCLTSPPGESDAPCLIWMVNGGPADEKG